MTSQMPAALVVVASRLAERVSLAGRPGNAHLPLVPEGLCHALHLGADTTACGLDIGDFRVFPGLRFATAEFLVRCGECAAALEPSR
jgi:hypothetical protein